MFEQLNVLAAKEGWPTKFDPLLNFEHPKLRALLDLWREKAGDGVPVRVSFDMRSLKPFLPHVLILEREGEGNARRFRFRLFGSALQLLFGEHTGRYLDEMVSAQMLPSWTTTYGAVLTARQPLRILTRFRIASAEFLEGEILAAPMSSGAGAVDQILAATYVDTKNLVLPQFE
ncbi:MAG TPA: PAS domain-containing protein [Rhizomicrobium sp.]|nr:PAS domain-containing protein [Rhizomicrobium sp.]